MWGVWWDEFPLVSFCCQEVLDGCNLRCGLQHLVDAMEFICGSLKFGTIVRMNGPWSSSTCDETSQGNKNSFNSQTSDYFNVDCLGGKQTNIAVLPLMMVLFVVFRLWGKLVPHIPLLCWGIFWIFGILLMEAHPWIVGWPLPLAFNNSGNDGWLSLPSFWFMGSNTSHVERLLVDVDQHEQVWCVLLTQLNF